jgi:8-oxo-dGTP pyrophosphatase MutT (NUDIX family)
VWRLFRPRLDGVRVLAIDSAGRVLLVRHSYGTPRWMAPGGGLRPGEDPILAAGRELAEETGCRLSAAQLLEVRSETLHGAVNVVRVVAGRCTGIPQPDGREIRAARFFAPGELPPDLPRSQRERLPSWLLAYASAAPSSEGR